MTGGVSINQSNRKIDRNPFKKDIQKYLCEGYSPEEVCRWLNEQTKNPDYLLSVATIRRVKYSHCPNVKTDKTKKLVKSHKEPVKKKTAAKRKNVQANFTVPSKNVTPEETVQKLLNIIYNNCEDFKDGNVVQALSAVARLINDKELETVDVENTMRRFVTNDKLKQKVQNAKYS